MTDLSNRQLIANHIVSRALGSIGIESSLASHDRGLAEVVPEFPSDQSKTRIVEAINTVATGVMRGAPIRVHAGMIRDHWTLGDLRKLAILVIPPQGYICSNGHYSPSGGTCEIDGEPLKPL